MWSWEVVGGQGKLVRRRGQERAGVRGQRGHCLEELSLETESPEAALTVSLDPGCSCLSDSACLILTCKSLARSFISFLLFLFLQVYLISFELPLFRPENAQRNIRRSEYLVHQL